MGKRILKTFLLALAVSTGDALGPALVKLASKRWKQKKRTSPRTKRRRPAHKRA